MNKTSVAIAAVLLVSLAACMPIASYAPMQRDQASAYGELPIRETNSMDLDPYFDNPDIEVGDRIAPPSIGTLTSSAPDVLFVGGKNRVIALKPGKATLTGHVLDGTYRVAIHVVDNNGIVESAKKLQGPFVPGSVYGPRLNQAELSQIRIPIAAFRRLCPDTLDDASKIAIIMGYLKSTSSYAPDWRKNKANTAWGSLIYAQGQCSGYARAFKALCDAVKIPCVYLHASSAAKPGHRDHQWNLVQLNGQWYHIDPQLSWAWLDMKKGDLYSKSQNAGMVAMLTPSYHPYRGEQYVTAKQPLALVMRNGRIVAQPIILEKKGNLMQVMMPGNGFIQAYAYVSD